MKNILVLIGLMAALAGGFWGVHAYTTWKVAARTSQFNEDVENLFTALQQYKEKVGSYPVGNNEDVMKALNGGNPKNVMILVGRKKDVNSKGEMVDPWGTPLRIYFSGNSILIRSAGPNKRFDDSTVLNSDDYYRSN